MKKAVILANEIEDDHKYWEISCEKHHDNLTYQVFSFQDIAVIEKLIKFAPDFVLLKPNALSNENKRRYDEIVVLINTLLNIPVFPDLPEILIYENKRIFSYWLKKHNIPHPQTHIVSDLKQIGPVIDILGFPIVAKANIGASGRGVFILKDNTGLQGYAKQVLLKNKIPQYEGSKNNKSGILKKLIWYLTHPGKAIIKIKVLKTQKSNTQYGFIILQQFIPHNFEWRVVRIGDSFFAHKKMKANEKASGSLIKEYGQPPIELLDFVKAITDKHKFYSQAVDVFETNEGEYLVNEMQCLFGQSDPYQMKINGKIGRYLYKNNQWVFEEGDFASNKCYDLRVEYVLRKMGVDIHP